MTTEAELARANIDRYRKLLAIETEEGKRATILRLLTEEEAKLAQLDRAVWNGPDGRRRR